MSLDYFKGNWKQFRGKVKEKWGMLTNDDLDLVEGKRDQLLGKIQERYGIARDEAERQLREWEATQEEVGAGAGSAGFHSSRKDSPH